MSKYFKPSVPLGKWGSVTVEGKDFYVIVEKDEDRFESVHLKEVNGEKTLLIEENNAILDIQTAGKWMGVLSATLYDKHTDYALINLEKLVSEQDDSHVYLGGLRGGWRINLPSIDFTVDFETETVTYYDGTERIKSFDDCFDPEVDKREAQAALLKCFLENRDKETLLQNFLNDWHNFITWGICGR